MEYIVLFLKTVEGIEPFTEWLYSIVDKVTRTKIETRVNMVQHGNFGKHRSVGGGVNELKINYGPGYRVYYARVGKDRVVIISGGVKKNKQQQQQDILHARKLWRDYENI